MIAPEQMLCPRDYQRFCVPGLPGPRDHLPGNAGTFRISGRSPPYTTPRSPEKILRLRLHGSGHSLVQMCCVPENAPQKCCVPWNAGNKSAVSPGTGGARKRMCCVPENAGNDKSAVSPGTCSAIGKTPIPLSLFVNTLSKSAGRGETLNSFAVFLLTTGFTAAAKISALTD